MSVVIVGGNERMVRRYQELCRDYRCDAKVFVKMQGTMREQIGRPDLLVLFTGTMSHKMVRCALNGTKGQGTRIARSHSSSMAALRMILEEHAGGAGCRS